MSNEVMSSYGDPSPTPVVDDSSASPSPFLPEGIVMGEFKECFIYNEPLSLLTFLSEDTTTVTRHLTPRLDVLLHGQTREPVGFQVWGVTKDELLAALSDGAEQRGSASTTGGDDASGMTP